MSKKITISEFIGEKAEYDPSGQNIWAVQKSGHLQMFLDLRGWGKIQHLFDDMDEAGKFQDSLGQWVADAINEKLTKSKIT